MSDAAAPLVAEVAAASTTLRETTKWLVAGVAATAAGVFAGTSLTNLGSLDPFEDGGRLLLALGGALMGFAGLALLMWQALRVLTVDAVTLRMLAQDPAFAKTARLLDTRFAGQLPGNAASLTEYSNMIDVAFAGQGLSENGAFLEAVRQFRPELMAQARFLHVRGRFDAMVRTLWLAVPIAILGFGLFSWAANPKERAPQHAPAAQFVAPA